jgi:hypothetical protein
LANPIFTPLPFSGGQTSLWDVIRTKHDLHLLDNTKAGATMAMLAFPPPAERLSGLPLMTESRGEAVVAVQDEGSSRKTDMKMGTTPNGCRKTGPFD